MSFRSLFDSLKPRSARAVARPGRRAAGRRPAAARLRLEPLEDRRVPTFSPAVTYPVAQSPPSVKSVAAGDFNGDGRSDLVTTSSSGISVLLNQGGGAFGAAVNYAVGYWTVDVVVSDFNADGKLDVATANNGTNAENVSVLLGNGNGTFGTARTFAIGQFAPSLVVGDFNGDDKPDLATTDNVLIGNGDGTFRAPVRTATGGSRLAAGDFNGDGKLDLAIGRLGGSGQVWLGNGDGTFRPNPSWEGLGRSPAVADFNADGNLDLVWTWGFRFGGNESEAAVDGVRVWVGQGDGTFADGFSWSWRSSFYSDYEPGEVTAADFDGDGRLDFAVTHPDSNTVRAFRNDGNGGFTAVPYSVVDFAAGVLVAGDWNGDGRPDLAVTPAGYDGSTVSVLVNDGIWLPSLTVDGVTVTEGNAGTTDAVFTVRLSSDPAETVTVGYSTGDGGSDYVATSGTLTFSPGGPLTQTITVSVLGDTLAEGGGYPYQESFRLDLTNPAGAYLARGTAYGNILDDEPTVSIDYGSVTEGDAGATDAVFTLRLSAPSPVPVAVEYTTFDLDPVNFPDDPAATAGSDYVPATGTVTFAPGTTTQTIAVQVLGDTILEGYEAFGIVLTSSVQAHIGVWGTLGTILDDESYVSVDSVSVREGNAGTVYAVFSVTLSLARSQAVTVDYNTADGSATAGSDYVATSGTLTVPAGQTRGTITVPITGDRLFEPTETFFVNLSQVTNANIANGQAQGQIVDDEPWIVISDVTKHEGRNRTTTLFTFTVRLLGAADEPVTVSYRTVNGTATTGDNDYVAKSGTLTFAPGEMSKTITITVKGDNRREADETFYVDLFGASSNSLLLDGRGVGTIVNDD